jgi:hypothetical protein
MKLYLSLILVFIFSFPAFSQTEKSLSKTKTPAVETGLRKDAATLPNTKDFSIQATVVYPSGEIVPIARQTFYVLDAELLTVLKEAGIEPTANTLQIYKGNRDKALINDAGYSFAGKFQTPYTELAAKVSEAIKPHIVQKIRTDSQGKAVFRGLDSEGSSYYLFGTGGMTYSNVIWNLPIDTTRDSSIILNQSNAVSLY